VVIWLHNSLISAKSYKEKNIAQSTFLHFDPFYLLSTSFNLEVVMDRFPPAEAYLHMEDNLMRTYILLFLI
jgi:hypothetical protein